MTPSFSVVVPVYADMKIYLLLLKCRLYLAAAAVTKLKMTGGKPASNKENAT